MAHINHPRIKQRCPINRFQVRHALDQFCILRVIQVYCDGDCGFARCGCYEVYQDGGVFECLREEEDLQWRALGLGGLNAGYY